MISDERVTEIARQVVIMNHGVSETHLDQSPWKELVNCARHGVKAAEAVMLRKHQKEIDEKDKMCEHFFKTNGEVMKLAADRALRIDALEAFLEMVIDPRKMPHQHTDPQLRLYCLAERASELLKKG